MSFIWRLLFVPHEKNNHRSLLLRPGYLTAIIGLYLLNQLAIKALTIVKPGVLGYSSEITVQKVYNLTNDQRQKNNLPVLHYNPVLSASATLKAQDMFEHNYWAHNSPQGKTPWDFFKTEGYQYSVAGENLAKDFYDTDTLMTAWMNSPTHRANIVNDKYQEIGIGVVNGILNGVKTTLVVQHFGTPLNVAKIDTQTPEELAYQSGQQEVLSEAVAPAPMVSPLAISRVVGLLLFSVIIGVLFVDAYITLKRQTHRLTGSTTGHIGFLLVIFVLLLFTRQGSIF